MLGTALKQGSYRPEAVKRVLIPKGDSRMRSPGIPVLGLDHEDRIASFTRLVNDRSICRWLASLGQMLQLLLNMLRALRGPARHSSNLVTRPRSVMKARGRMLLSSKTAAVSGPP